MTKIKICDAMMGSGKTSAAINYMNTHLDERFLFITPYLDECKRIRDACSVRGRKFYAPWQNENTKFENMHLLLERGECFASTHAMMHKFNARTIELIRKWNYTLVLDEVFDVLNVTDLKSDDISMLRRNGVISVDSNGDVRWNDRVYGDDGSFSDFRQICDQGLVHESGEDMLVWQFPTSVFEAFGKVIILTYMFSGQIQRAYFDINNLEYEYIGVRRVNDQRNPENISYEFCDRSLMDVQKHDWRPLIHLIDRDDLNAVGDTRGALSISWVRRDLENGGANVDAINQTVENIRRHIWNAKADGILWTAAKDSKPAFQKMLLTDKRFLSWNYRATNEYRHKTHLFYLHNVFLNPNILGYLRECGTNVTEEDYARSALIQWIWRSAIRDGNEIWIYIPSRRMRDILTDWLDEVTGGPRTTSSLL